MLKQPFTEATIRHLVLVNITILSCITQNTLEQYENRLNFVFSLATDTFLYIVLSSGPVLEKICPNTLDEMEHAFIRPVSLHIQHQQ